MSEVKNTSAKAIYLSKKVGDRVLRFGVFMFALFVACAAFILLAPAHYRKLSIVLSATWVVGVPVYFFFEHIVLFRKFGDPEQYDQFKRVQDLAAKIWAAAIVVMTAFYAESFTKAVG